jgi:hypothetical protein
MAEDICSRKLSMTDYTLTRRRFLAACAMASGAVAVGCRSRLRHGWEILDEDDAEHRHLEQLCADAAFLRVIEFSILAAAGSLAL